MRNSYDPTDVSRICDQLCARVAAAFDPSRPLNIIGIRTRGEVLDISGLCGFIDATRTSVWRRLGELAELGLIVRHPDPGDARRVMLEITDEPFNLIVEMALRKSI